MKDPKEKEHRISNLKDMIDTVKDEDDLDMEDIEEDAELIDYLNEGQGYGNLEIDDEFIYHPDNEDNYAVNLEENQIDEDYLIKTPKESDEKSEEEMGGAITGEISESFDNIMNAKIGRTPILGVVSTVLGLIFIVLAATTFSSRSEKIVDNVISGENSFIVVIFLILGLMLLIYGLYKVIGFKNPLSNLSDSIDSIENEKDESEKMKKDDENVLPKSNIPLDKESYKIGEFGFDDLKNNLKKSKAIFKTKTTPIEENIDDIPPAREKPEERKGLTAEEIEEIEYEQVVLESESIDDIFAEVEKIEDIHIDTKEGKKEE